MATHHPAAIERSVTVEGCRTGDDARLLRKCGDPYEMRTAPAVIGVRKRSWFTSRRSGLPWNLANMDAGRWLVSTGGEKSACAACQNRVATNVVRHQSRQRAMSGG